ncbi:MAG: methyltransferase domain-containing protein [Candidatus Marinimicrobia bacterium]|nr:methyltransferase domain-containing protein [Candidatus Neomarinimicrobiota bacterium]
MFNFILIISITAIFVSVLILLNDLSYNFMKNRIIARGNWDLNICCGKTDVGKVNADIVKHSDVKNFVQISNIYQLPFRNNQFDEILCSHTIEHIENPQKFHEELSRIGRRVTYLVPPLWDVTAALNIFEHRWIFLTLKKQHHQLPPHIKLPLAYTYQKLFGQKIKA